MIHTQTEIDNLVELAIIQRAELKKLVESLPQLRDHLSSEIERNLEEIEPAIRSELEQFVTARALDAHAQTSTALTAKIDELARSLETTTAARYSVLIAEREKNESLLAQAEARIAEAASALPGSVKEIVAGELARFPRAGEIDQLRKEFAEPKGLNPRGKWVPDESYQRLDLVTFNGDSFVSNIDGNRERPSRSAADWTLNAARGNSGGGGGITSLTDLLPIPTSGQILGSEGTSYVPKTLVAGSNITITETPTTITITGDEGQIELQDGTEAAPSLFFVSDTNTGLYRPAADTVGIVGGGNDVVRLTGVASATDYLEIKNGTGTGNPLHVLAEGASANIGVHLQPKGSGLFTISDGTDFNKGIRFRSSSSAASAVTLIDAVSTAGRVVTLPDATDTLVGRSTTDTLSNKTMIAPALGTPTALVGTNITGTAAGLTAGNVTTNANLTGDVTSVGNATSIAAGVIVDADINASAAIADTKLATISTAGKVSNSATTATSANTASAIVARDGSGNFTAGTITANLTGNVSGSSGSTTGNAATATALQTARAINGVNFDGTAPITVTADAGTLTGSTLAAGVTASSLTSVGTLGSLTVTNPITGSVTGSSGSTTGNAATATALATARAINGVNFDGTAPITVTAAAGTLSGTTLAAGVTASSLTSLGTIASLTATAGTISTTPTASTDIANKLYVDTVAQGLDAKASCVAATTADITLSGAQTIDGVSVVAGNRVLVKNQSLSQNNGIYLCASGSWTRTTDANTWDALTSAFTFIEQGTVNADTGYVCTANAGGTLGTTALPWSQFSGAGTFTAGTGLTLTGSVFSLTSPVAVANGGTGLTSLGSGVATFLGTPSSANLAAAVSDETGSGALVFATSPTLVTPALGTPSALVGTNITGTAAAFNINGTVGATTPSTGAFTTGAFSGQISQTGGGVYLSLTGSTTGATYQESTTTGGRYRLGIESSTGGALVGGGTAYATVLSSVNNVPVQIGVNNAIVSSFTSTGLNSTAIGATTPSTVAATTITTTGTATFTKSANSAGSVAALLQNADGNSGIGARLAWRLDNLANEWGYINVNRVGGGGTAQMDIAVNSAAFSGAPSVVASLTSTGLAVTGALSSTSSILSTGGGGGSTSSGQAKFGGDTSFGAMIGGFGSTSDVTILQRTGSAVAQFSSTGLAVTGAVSASGNLNFTGTANRITGDFANATIANRVAFQNSTANSATVINALPSGTGTASGFVAYNNSDPTNAALIRIVNTGTEGAVQSGINGTGTYLPMTFYTGGSERARIDTSGNLGIGTASPAVRLDVVPTSTDGDITALRLYNNRQASAATKVSLQFYADNDQVLLTAGRDGAGTSGTFNILTRKSGTQTSSLFINETGNVGIGTTSPASKLDVNGELRIGNTVASAVAVASTHKVTIVIGGTTYYLLATNV